VGAISGGGVLDVAAEAKMVKILLPFKPNLTIPDFSRFKHFPYLP
jgi:hypothetical protein